MNKSYKQHLTSTKIDQFIWDEFQINTTKYKTSFHDVAEKALYLFNSDPDFRSKIINTRFQYQKPEIND